MSEIRVRFAPSPTGFLHIGGARTALFNWLFARGRGGKFILRIEDTDKERSRPEMTQGIIDGLRFLGLDWDEGPEVGGPCGPYMQSERNHIYAEFVKRGIASGCLYRCYCSKEELEIMREHKMRGEARTAYDRRWRDRPASDVPEGAPYVLRMKMPPEGETIIHDAVQGEVRFDNSDLEDFIAVRTDGSPTYNFCVVADDVHMRISHVVRGVDHLSNTALQLNIYRAVGLEPPVFAHVGLIHGPDGSKYSKRHGAVDVMDWRRNGYLPQALRNYFVRLGWSKGDEEIMSLKDMIAGFDVDHLGKAKAVVNLEKLAWVNQQYITAMMTEEPAKLGALLAEYMEEFEGLKPAVDERLLEIARQLGSRSKTMREMAPQAKGFFVAPAEYLAEDVAKHLQKDGGLARLAWLTDELERCETFDVATMEKIFTAAIEKFNVKLLKLAQPVRVALMGRAISPGIFETLVLIGKDESISRMRRTLAKFPA